MTVASKRLHYIDWLRVLAVLLLFPFHTARVFNYGEPFYVKGPEASRVLSAVLGFIDAWHMPLLFLLAGAASCFALHKRTGGQYVVERLKRLLVPLLFGFFVLIPPQTWYGARFNSGYTGSFLGYITSGDFLVWNIRDGGDYFGGFGLGHLWFIVFLFMISLLALPLLLWGRTEKGAAALRRFAVRLSKPVWWLLVAVIILIAEGLPDLGGKNPFVYLVFFCFGYIVMFDESFMDAAERYRWPALVIGAAGSLFWVLTGQLRDSLPDPSVQIAVLVLVGLLGKWTAIVGLLGAGTPLAGPPVESAGVSAPRPRTRSTSCTRR